MTRKVKAQGKLCFVHLDMVQGLNAKDNYALTFLKKTLLLTVLSQQKLRLQKLLIDWDF